METLLSLTGIAGALCCVGMYAAVSFGRISAEQPLFYIVNGIGALLVLAGAAHSFDMGDLGTIGQELIWGVVSLVGAARAWSKAPAGVAAMKRTRRTLRVVGGHCAQAFAALHRACLLTNRA